MKTDIKNMAGFLACAIWADGIYAGDEKASLSEIAEALQVDENALAKEVDQAVASLRDKDDDAVEAFLIENASAIDEAEARIALECAIEIVLADDTLTLDEAQVLIDLAEATGVIAASDVVLMVADLAKYNEDLKIAF